MIPSFSCTILLDESQAAIMFLLLQKTKNIGKNEQYEEERGKFGNRMSPNLHLY
jgi:hypothetical protein